MSVAIDFAAADAWVACAPSADELATCEQASATTPGGHLAELARPTFGDMATPGEVTERDRVAELVARMKAWPDVLARAERFMPAPVGGPPLQAFIVANGNPWGDAYVRRFEGTGDAAQVSEQGEPVVMLNAVRIAAVYPGTAEDQASRALGVLAHELFHALFRRYRAHEPGWITADRDTSPRQALQILVLNEGVAHFVDRGDHLVLDGFPSDKAAPALQALAAAWAELAALPPGPEADRILTSASQGPYWSKYGSIGGMLLAYGVFQTAGADGLKQAVRCGPGRLLALYVRATESVPTLPVLPPSLQTAAWFDLCAAVR